MNKQILRAIILTGLFLVPFVPFLVSNSLFFPFITTKAFVWRIIIEIIFSAWLLLAFSDTNYRPKKSLILYSIFGFLAVIGLADIFGVATIKSFWSNFERMEGFITLLHLGMFFVVISSVFGGNDPASAFGRTKSSFGETQSAQGSGEAMWKRWWNVSLLASFLMVLYSVLQIIGLKTINQGGVRVDGTLGNAIYLAAYMLFHIFIAVFFMWREWKNVILRWVYGLLILAQAFILYHTATRGAILGLLGGLFIMAVFNIRNKEDQTVRKLSIAVLAGLVILIGSFAVFKDKAFIQNSPVLSRFSSLTTEALKTQGRYFVWPIAVEGFKERPLLGWGQENFTYVFQKHYSPEMFNLEPWFDRVHNIFLDWAIAGGLLGLIAYLSLYFTLLYLIWKPVRELVGGENKTFSHTEKSILTGLIAAYFFHNFFVFDHLISYVLFFSLLAYVHYRTADEVLWEKSISEIQVWRIVLPIVSILLVSSLYFVNVKPIMTNVFLIEALKAIQTPEGETTAIRYFQKAYNTSHLGRAEAVEHMSSNSIGLLKSNISIEEKNAFFTFVKDAVVKQNENFKNDARQQLLTGSFLSSTGLLDEALAALEHARDLMPGKQQIYFEIGAVFINKNEPLKALEIFKKAYDLAPEYSEAKLIYLIGAIYTGDRTIENNMLGQLTEREVVFDDRIINAYYSNKRINEVVDLLGDRIRLDPNNIDKYKELIRQIRG